MTDRAIFNRRYTDFTPGGTQVWLVNGAGVTTSIPSSSEFTAGTNLIQGQAVYVSGTYVFPATAASGVSADLHNVIGITADSAVAQSGVLVNLDSTVIVNDVNITAESTLVPGQYYFLSKYQGEITRYSTASGVISVADGYAVSAPVGVALSTSELQLEIETPAVIYS